MSPEEQETTDDALLDAPAVVEAEDRYERVLRWASPGLDPSWSLDPWEAPLPLGEVRRIARERAR